jgi:hypothetical protein
VTIPVGIYSAIEEQEIRFNQLHGACGSRIKQRRFCPVCNRDVEYDELVKGYEIAKDQYVRLTPSELDQLRATESEAMEIVEFVPLTAIDPIYFENTFHLGAEKQGEKPYQLLVHAMEEMERVALAKFIWRGSETMHGAGIGISFIIGEFLLVGAALAQSQDEDEQGILSEESPSISEGAALSNSLDDETQGRDHHAPGVHIWKGRLPSKAELHSAVTQARSKAKSPTSSKPDIPDFQNGRVKIWMGRLPTPETMRNMHRSGGGGR